MSVSLDYHCLKFVFFKIFFLMWTIINFTEFVTILFLLYVCFLATRHVRS